MTANITTTTNAIRQATHAGSWYLDDALELDKQLTDFLAAAKVTAKKNARAIIAPHAGFSYSGATAAHAYASWDIASVDRVIVLGPSHHVPLSGCALSHCTEIATPLGNLPADMDTTDRLATSFGGHFTWMSKSVDEAEHSLEMHFPYIAKVFKDAGRALPQITQILVGDLTPELDRVYGDLIARELADPAVGLVVSSDFCHWGQRFKFTHYTPTPTAACACAHPRAHHHHHDAAHHANVALPWTSSGAAAAAGGGGTHARAKTSDMELEEAGWSARTNVHLPAPKSTPVHLAKCADPASVLAARNAVPIDQSIEALDRAGMHLVERLDLPGWIAYLAESKNTVCGRNPIRLALVALNDLYEASLELAAVATAAAADPQPAGSMALPQKPKLDAQVAMAKAEKVPVLKFVKYAQSSRVAQLKDSSVSYASAYAIVPEGVERILGVDADVEDAMDEDEREVLRGDESTNLGDDADEDDVSQATSGVAEDDNDVDAEGDSRMGDVDDEDEREEEK